MKLCIFDLDGTLLDTLSVIADNSNYVIEKYNYKPIDKELFTSFIGNGAGELMKSIARYRNIDSSLFDDMYSEFLKRYDENPIGDTVVFDGITDLVEKLKASGKQLAVLTNKPHNAAVSSVTEFFGDNIFDAIIGQKESLMRKPHPECVEILLKDFAVTKEDAIMIGDSDVDIATGKNAGISTCAVSWGFKSREELLALEPDYLVDNTDELLRILLED